MIPTQFAPLASHLWQSTLFAGAAALLTLALRRNSARVRYAIWLAASYKFLIPFSWLVSFGHLFEWHSAPPLVPQAIATVTNVVGRPVFLMPSASVATTPQHSSLLPVAIWSIWACGFLLLTAGWAREWSRIRRMAKQGTQLDFALPIPVVSVSSQLEPGVFGIFRPVLLLPAGIAQRLTPEQLRAVIAHELCHVRRRDNLASAIHMLVEALLWFHPLVWWLDARMIDERERACDEEVLRMGNAPADYAETILAVCKSYVESPIACMSGISGADLKRRVVNVMANRRIENLGPARKLLLSALGIVATAVPIVFGIVNAPLLRAQSATAEAQGGNTPSFEVASVKKHASDSSSNMSSAGDVSHWARTNVTAKWLIKTAYNVKDFQLEGGPSWLDSEHFDVDAKVDDSAAARLRKLPMSQQQEQMALMLRPLLADRFKLQITRATKEGAVLTLVLAKGGPKLKEAPPPDPSAPPATGLAITPDHLPTPPPGQSYVMMMNGFGILTANGVQIARLVDQLSSVLNKQVVDQTNLKGTYQYALKYDPQLGIGAAPPGGDVPPSPELLPIFAALQDQLGLKLEPAKGQIDTITINHIEQPTPN